MYKIQYRKPSTRFRIATACVVTAAIGALLVQTEFANAADAWSLTADQSVAGTTVTLTSSFTAPVSGQYILDTEVYNSSDVRVAQAYQEQSVETGVTTTFHYGWTGTAGTFHVDQGVFNPNWAGTVAWTRNTAVIQIGDSTWVPTMATTTPATVTEPTPTTVKTTSTTVKKTTPTSTKTTVTTVKPTPTTAPAAKQQNGDVLSGMTFYGSNPDATQQGEQWQTSRPADAALMTRLGAVPSATWITGGDPTGQVSSLVNAAAAQNKTAMIVAYNIPNRDCGGFSSGGASSESDYNTWADKVASGLGGHHAVIDLEPDALGVTSCLSGDALNARYRMLSHAVQVMTAAGGYVYTDASTFVAPAQMASELKQAGINGEAGFALNTSGFSSNSAMNTYGAQLSAALGGGKHWIVDTSRNGKGGGDGQWCNPPNQAVGTAPTANTGVAGSDAYLWLKTPGQSDGNCNGGPGAGTFWADYALGLVKNAGW